MDGSTALHPRIAYLANFTGLLINHNAGVEEEVTGGAGQAASEWVPVHANSLAVIMGAFSPAHSTRRSLVHPVVDFLPTQLLY